VEGEVDGAVEYYLTPAGKAAADGKSWRAGLMKWVRIGEEIINPLAIKGAIDRGERETAAGKQRWVTLTFVDGEELHFAGTEADTIWSIVTGDLEVWLETYNPPTRGLRTF
jgi:hypothetical protein